jgi:hypothetical protein
MEMEKTVRYETSAHKIQTLGESSKRKNTTYTVSWRDWKKTLIPIARFQLATEQENETEGRFRSLSAANVRT